MKLNIIPRAKQLNLSDYLTLGKANNQTVADVYDKPATLVNALVRNIFVVAGIIIFIFIIGAGFSFLQDSSQAKEKSKTMVTGAIIGFIVMFSAYWIVQIISAMTGAKISL